MPCEEMTTYINSRNNIIEVWPFMRNKISQELLLHWTFSDKLAMLDGVAMTNHMGIEKTRLLPRLIVLCEYEL